MTPNPASDTTQSVDELAKTVLLLAIRSARGDQVARSLLVRTQHSAKLLTGWQPMRKSQELMGAVATLASRLADDDQLRAVSEAVQTTLDGRGWESLAREVALDCGMLEFG